MPFLAEPSESYKDSCLEALRESHAEGWRLELDIGEVSADFGGFVQRLLSETDRSKLKPGLVPQTVLWLIDDGEYIGRLSIRHELNESLRRHGGHIGYEIRPSKRRQGYGTTILKLGLEKAKELGLHKVLLTCNSRNIGSRRIIEHNGGVLEDEIDIEVNGMMVPHLRYWIDIE